MKRFVGGPRDAGACIARWIALLMFYLATSVASAQVIDRVDIQRSDGEVEIHIRFVTTVQYLRHFPQSEGEFLHIQIQLTGTGPSQPLASQTPLESYRPPTNGLIAPITVAYPEEDRTLGVRFSKLTRYRVRPAPDGRGILVYVPVEAPATPAGPPAGIAPEAPRQPPVPEAAVPRTAEEVETQAAALLQQAKGALARDEPQAAVELLNRLLNLPPTSVSQEAQKLIGEARERNGEIAKARAEYELYLKLYPDSEAAQRVRKRLAALPAEAPIVGGIRQARRPDKTEITTSGNFFQSYYYGASKFDSTLVAPTPGLRLDQPTLTTIDQSALVSNLDVTTRIRAPSYDGKLVMRDIFTKNNLAGGKDTNRLYAAYYEHQTADNSFLGRFGRQPGFSGGVLGLYDGAWAGYRVLPMARVNVVAGVPVEFFPVPQKYFYGLNVDLGPWRERWSGNAFMIEQRVDSVVDRRAVGGEVRYFGPRTNVFALFDYDIAFKALNTAVVQGNWLAESGTNYTAMLDHRRVPTLQITNALVAESGALPGILNPSVGQLLQSGRSLDSLRQEALAITPMSTLLMAGFTHPVTPSLQLGTDVRVSTVSGTAATGNFPSVPGTGNIYVYSGQAIKTALFTRNDTGVANLSIIEGATYSGRSATLNYVLLTGGKWRTQGTLLYYYQHNNVDVTLKRYAPSLRLEYRHKANLTFQIEGGV